MEQIVIEMRNKNYGYATIANQLGITKDKVRYICKKHNLTRNEYKSREDYKLEFIKYLGENYKNLKLISEYKNATTKVTLKCNRCKSTFEILPDSIKRKKYKGCTNCNLKIYKCSDCNKEIGIYNDIKYKYGRGDNTRYYCSELCFIKSESKECKVCKNMFLSKYNAQKTCSIECKDKLNQFNIDKQYKQRRMKFKSQVKKCKYCGEEFKTTFKRQLAEYCSEECGKKMQNRNKDIHRRHKIRENGKVDSDITLPKLFENYKGICSICGDKCNYDDYIETKEGHFIAGDEYPSIDHIIPIAKGGTHTWNNVQLAHRKCNTIKRDGFIEEEGQLRII